VAEDGEARNGDGSSNVEQESLLISGPQEFSIVGPVALHGKEY